MARWKIREKHYLNVLGTEWQHIETSQQTGKQGRKIYHVPRFLDPNDPSDHTNGRDIVVAYEGKTTDLTDLIFEGDPTPDMEPIDEEAKAISASFAKKWVHPIDSLPSSYSESILADLQDQIDEIGKKPANKSLSSVSQDAFEALQKQVAELMEQNAKLQAAKPVRRI